MTVHLQRPLSPVERWYWIADQISPLNGVVRVRLHGSMEPGLLEAAAAALAAEYPVLRVAITADADGTNPAFTPSWRAIEVRSVTGDDGEWHRQIENELATSMDWRTGPLARVVHVAVQGTDEIHDVLLAMSHVIADAASGLSVLHRLIEYADRLMRCAADKGQSFRSFGAAPEELLPARYRGVRGFARIAATVITDRLAAAIARPRSLRPESAVPPAQRRTKLLCRRLSADQVNMLVQKCRVEGVTVNAALGAAMAMAIGPVAARRASGRITIGSPVDVRAELVPPVPADEVGVYVSTVPWIAPFGGGRDLWAIARQGSRSLNWRMRHGHHLVGLSVTRHLCPSSLATSAKFIRLIERNGPGNVCLSNIGRYDFPAQVGQWSLSGAQFIAGVSVSGYFVATVNTSHGELFWNFTYIDDAVSRRSAQQYADTAVTRLLEAIGASRATLDTTE